MKDMSFEYLEALGEGKLEGCVSEVVNESLSSSKFEISDSADLSTDPLPLAADGLAAVVGSLSRSECILLNYTRCVPSFDSIIIVRAASMLGQSGRRRGRRVCCDGEPGGPCQIRHPLPVATIRRRPVTRH